MTTPPKIITQNRIEAYDGIKIETIKKEGSDGQKLMVSLFDQNHDGQLDEKEAEEFNRYNFSVKEGEVTLYRKNDDGTKSSLTLLYDNFEEDVLNPSNKGNPKNSISDELDFKFKNDKGEICSINASETGSRYRAIIDMIKGAVTLKGRDSSCINAKNVDLSLEYCDVKEVRISDGSLNLKNTKNRGSIWDSAVNVTTNNNTVIRSDKNSDYEINK